ncbi:3931_t:CDS:2 [Gigaspora rosea]|nr:3931_t:CDS:2 [Gigaspora rosea]
MWLIGKMTLGNSSKVDVYGFSKIQCMKFKYMYGSPSDDIEEMDVHSDILKDVL